MPYTTENPPDRIKKLPKHAQEIWVSAYNSAIEQYDGDEERANKVAWAAVKRDYKQVDGKWVKKMDMKYLSMAISKVVKHNGVMHFETTVSNDEWDRQDERLTIELFEDFIRREEIEKMEQGDAYKPPFVSVSHYNTRSGDVNEQWIQGNRFKTRGILYDDKHGRALFKAVLEERLKLMKGEEVEKPIKVSIGFFPYATRKEDGKIVYIKGEFHHEAATRVPVNEDTSFDEVTEKAMPITKKEDAASIIGLDLAEELEVEERSRKEKGELKDLVIKAEQDSLLTEAQEIELKALLEEEGEDDESIEKAQWTYDYKRNLPDSAYLWVESGAKCKKEDGKAPQSCRHLPYKDAGGKIDCDHLRAAIQAIGGARTGKPMSVPSGVSSKAKRLYARHCQEKGKALVEIPQAELVQRPYGGATSIADAVSYMEGQEAAWKLGDDVRLFQNVVENILRSEEVDDKKAAISKAVSELNALLKPDVGEEEKMDKKEKGKTASVVSLIEEGIKSAVAAGEGDKEADAPEEGTSLDALFGAYKSIVYSKELDRKGKIAGAYQCLKLIGTASDKIISETTPRSEADIVAEIADAVEGRFNEAVKGMAERLAVLEAKQRANVVTEPERKGFTVVGKAESQEEPVKKGSLAFYARQMSGLDPETGKAIF